MKDKLFIIFFREGIYETQTTYEPVIRGEDNAKREFEKLTSTPPIDNDGIASLYEAKFYDDGIARPISSWSDPDPIIELMWDPNRNEWRNSDDVVAEIGGGF